MKEIKVHYHNTENKIEQIGGCGKSVGIDLYTEEDVYLEIGKYHLISLGVTVKPPEGYWFGLVPRGSTFKKHGILQANSIGVVDPDYCSYPDDKIYMPVFVPIKVDDLRQAFYDFQNDPYMSIGDICTGSVFISKGTRICQLVLFKNYDISVIESDLSKEIARSGFGSTGN